jgi:ABC-type arginine transport system ATPase subunit
MSKHTPGPWTVIRRRDGLVIAGPGVALFGDQDERAADANIIAAAPELLEALEAEEYAQRLANHHESQMQAKVARARADKMRASAIAKARGEP